MLDRYGTMTGTLRAERSVPVAVAELIVGRPAEEAAALLPRLFNLCRAAQEAAARMAFGLPSGREHIEAVRTEILREHLVKLCLSLPARFGASASGLPEGWKSGGVPVRAALFGERAALPSSPQDFAAFLQQGAGLAGLLARVRDCFATGEACTGFLPDVDDENVLGAVAIENSVAGRQAAHPVLQSIEQDFGRGPFWRATARAYDTQDCLDDALPLPVCPAPGVAIVPAARGSYAIMATVEDGIVTAFRRITPTDHLMARGGVLDQALATLPQQKNGLAPLVLDILDPCIPVRLREVDHA